MSNRLLPTKEHRSLTIGIFILFIIILISYIPGLLAEAEASDLAFNRTVRTTGDDHGYQILALNLLYTGNYSYLIILPPETYNVDLTTPWGEHLQAKYQNNQNTPIKSMDHVSAFYRAPGFPLMLAGVYGIFGNKTIVARRMLAILLWLTALLLLITGAYMAGWIGAIAGGLAGIYHINFFPGYYFITFDRILTEIPTAFLVTLFGTLFVLFLKTRRTHFLILAAASLVSITFFRPNFLLVFPLIVAYLYYQKFSRKELLVFSIIALLPVGIWATFASISEGKPVFFTTQGEIAFPQVNNIDVLEGVGPERVGRGAWQPGEPIYNDEGEIVTYENAAQPGENGWAKGFKFWEDNLTVLPRLFYVKLEAGFWYWYGESSNQFQPEGIFLIGIGFLLVTIGFRPPNKEPLILKSLTSGHIIVIQLILIMFLILIWNKVALWLILLTWLIILLVGLLRPYGDYYQFNFPNPIWFLSFVICHGFVTILFIGVRYHWPLDPLLMSFSFLGIGLVLYELLLKNRFLFIPFLMLVLGTIIFRFGLFLEI